MSYYVSPNAYSIKVVVVAEVVGVVTSLVVIPVGLVTTLVGLGPALRRVVMEGSPVYPMEMRRSGVKLLSHIKKTKKHQYLKPNVTPVYLMGI